MKNLKKRLTALVLTLAMVLALAPVMTASAEGAYSPGELGDTSADITYRELYNWESEKEDYDLFDWINDVLPKHKEDLGIHGEIDHWSEIPGAAVLAIEWIAAFAASIPASLATAPYHIAEMIDPSITDFYEPLWGRYVGAALAASASKHQAGSTMIEGMGPDQARTKCSVYSACGSLFWDEACTSPVQELNNRSNNVIGYTIVAPDNGTWGFPPLNNLHITYTLPDGFLFSNGEKTYEEGFSPDGYSGNAAWAWLPPICPIYVGDAAPDTYYCVRVNVEGTYSMSNNAGNRWDESVSGSVEVPFCYVADAWNSVTISGGEIGSTTINWDSEHAFQTNRTAGVYNGDTARLSAALSALSQDPNATVDALRRMGFRSVVVNGGNEEAAGMGVITGTKVLSDGNFTIGVVTGAAGDSDWLSGLDVGNDIRYVKDIYPAAVALRGAVTDGVYGIRPMFHTAVGNDLYVLCTGFGKAGAVAAEMANIISGTAGRAFATAYTFGAPHYRRQGADKYNAYVYNLVYAQDPICAAPSGQYYSSLGETYYVLNSGINPVKDKGNGTWTDNCGVTYKTVSWVGDYTDQGGNTAQNISQCATVNELIAAALHAWDPYNPNSNEANPNTVVYLAQVEAVLQQYGASLRDVSPQAHSMAVYWQLLDGAWHPSSTNAAWFHRHFADLYKAFFAPRPDDTKKPGEEPTSPTSPPTRIRRLPPAAPGRTVETAGAATRSSTPLRATAACW